MALFTSTAIATCDMQIAMAQQQMALQQTTQAMAAQQQMASIYINSMLGNTTSTYTNCISNISSISTTTFTICGSGGTGGFYGGVVEIDEEDYVNHAEYYELAKARGIAYRIRTAEEKRLRDEAMARARAEQEQREHERKAAQERARELLLSHLTAAQRKTVEKNKWFVVIGGKTKTEYRIRTDYGVSGNIEVFEKGKKVASLCCHCKHEIPEGDQFLAQAIALKFDEDNFLKIANRRAA